VTHCREHASTMISFAATLYRGMQPHTSQNIESVPVNKDTLCSDKLCCFAGHASAQGAQQAAGSNSQVVLWGICVKSMQRQINFSTLHISRWQAAAPKDKVSVYVYLFTSPAISGSCQTYMTMHDT